MKDTTCFADRKLTKLTERFKRERSRLERRRILREALPLCEDVPDVRMLYTNVSHTDPLRRMVNARWDAMMSSRVEGVSRWTREKCHRMYLLCRSGSEAERYVLGIWQSFNLPRCLGRCHGCGAC